MKVIIESTVWKYAKHPGLQCSSELLSLTHTVHKKLYPGIYHYVQAEKGVKSSHKKIMEKSLDSLFRTKCVLPPFENSLCIITIHRF